jgi:hypothetical protein
MHAPLRRALLGLASVTLVAGTAAGTAAPAVAATPQAESSAGWLVRQLTDGLIYNNQFGGFNDYGLTLDVWYALNTLDVREGAQQDILDALESRISDYTTYEGDTYAGSVAKLLTAVETAGIDPATYGDGSLLSTLQGLVVTEGPETGRAKDDQQSEGDFSNTITQSFAVRALSLADDELEGSTTAYLLDQQCAAGFFRESMGSDAEQDFTCELGQAEGTSAPSVDATAFAVMALRVARAGGVEGLGDDIKDAISWLRSVQNDNGSFTGNDVPNANTTGLAAGVLAGVAPRAAAKAAEWLDGLRVTRGMASDGALGGEAGAVAYNRKAFREGRNDGISDANRDQWRRATAQAAIGLNSLPS